MEFVKPHVFVLIGIAVMVLALLLQIVGLATVAWTSGNIFGRNVDFGLFQTCSVSCASYDGDTYIQACRAFGILAVLAMVASLACALLICFMSEKKIFSLLTPLAAFVGAFCVFIEFTVFAGEMSGGSFGYSFGLTVVAFILALAAGILFILNYVKSRAS